MATQNVTTFKMNCKSVYECFAVTIELVETVLRTGRKWFGVQFYFLLPSSIVQPGSRASPRFPDQALLYWTGDTRERLLFLLT